MATMLSAIIAARRRRYHLSGGSSSSATTSGYGSTSHSMAHLGEKLGEAAREAKHRLDEKLRAQWNSENKRASNGQQWCQNSEGRHAVLGDAHGKVFKLKKRMAKRFSCSKLSWKSWQHGECAVCLEQFKAGDTLMQLPCAHKFHSGCLVPWLETNARCPCCRMEISMEWLDG